MDLLYYQRLGQACQRHRLEQLYVGELVYNRQRFVKDPETGKRRSKLNPEADWLVQAVPELAIIDRGTFDTAQTRRAAASCDPYRAPTA